MADYTHHRAGLPLAQFKIEARGLDAAALATRYSSAFLLRQPGTGAGAGMILQTLTAHSAAARADRPASPGLLEYHVHVLRRAGETRFGGDYIGIGRGENNDLVAEDASVSKFHAVVMQEKAAFLLSDAGSKNGTFLNDKPVPNYREGRSAPLRDGDAVRVGDVRFTFMVAESLWRLLQRG